MEFKPIVSGWRAGGRIGGWVGGGGGTGGCWGAIPDESLSKALNYIRTVNQERESERKYPVESFSLADASLLFPSA